MRGSLLGSLSILILALTCSTSCLLVSAQAPYDLQKKQADSISRLDSLVTHYRFSNTMLAKYFAIQALQFAQTVKSRNGETKAYVMLGLTYLQINKDSSYIFFGKALEIAKGEHNESQQAHVYYCIASLYFNVLDFKTAIVFLDSSLKFAERSKSFVVVADVYNLLGNIRSDLKDIPHAKTLYEKSFQISLEHGLWRQCGLALVNLATLEPNNAVAVNKYYRALWYFKKSDGCEEELSRTLINIGSFQKNPDSAMLFFKRSLDISIKGNMPLSQIGAYNNMAYSYMDKGDLLSAESCLRDKAIPLAQAIQNLEWLATLFDSYSDVLLAKGENLSAAQYAKKALNTRMEADQLQSSQQVRLLASLLDLKTKELTIRVKEQELFQEHSALNILRLWLFITILILSISITLVFWIRQRGRMKLQQVQLASARLIIELDEREKSIVARELHDLTGQMQVAILGCFENMKVDDKSVIDFTRDQIVEVGVRMRRLSHRLNSKMVGQSAIGDLLRDLCEDMEQLSRLKISLEIEEMAPVNDPNTSLHLYRIAQELLTNAAKYLKNGVVILHIIIEEKRVLISYSDSGPGFNTNVKHEGMGIMNIYERVKLLNGEGILISSEEKGTSWEISFPNR